MIELMIALVISGVLFSGLMAIFIANLDHYRRTIDINRLTEELQAIMSVMTTEIRRAGYSGTANVDIGTHTNTNPFMANGVDINVDATKDCILFAYDHNSDGILPSISSSYDDERYGFRLLKNQVMNTGTAAVNVIQTRGYGGTYSCTPSSGDGWQNLSDVHLINITNLQFTLTTDTMTTGPGSTGIAMRSVDITLTGQLVYDPTVTETLTEHVKVRNDEYIGNDGGEEQVYQGRQ